jgi:hypothetical protein
VYCTAASVNEFLTVFSTSTAPQFRMIYQPSLYDGLVLHMAYKNSAKVYFEHLVADPGVRAV